MNGWLTGRTKSCRPSPYGFVGVSAVTVGCTLHSRREWRSPFDRGVHNNYTVHKSQLYPPSTHVLGQEAPEDTIHPIIVLDRSALAQLQSALRVTSATRLRESDSRHSFVVVVRTGLSVESDEQLCILVSSIRCTVRSSVDYHYTMT